MYQGIWKFGIIGILKICCDGTIVKLSTCYLIPKLEPVIRRVYLPQFLAINFFFHELAYWRYEGFKYSVPHTQQKKNELSDLQQVKSWRRKIIDKTMGKIHPFNSRFKFLYQIICLGTVTSNSWPLCHTQQIFHLPIIENLHTPWRMFLFPDLW